MTPRACLIKKEHPLMKSLGHKPRTGDVLTCPICKKEFYIKPYSSKKGVIHCCSRKCAHKQLDKGVNLNCAYCGNKYHTTPSQIRHRGSRFCSRRCFGKWNSIYKTGKNSPTWQGGKSKVYHRLRVSKAFKDWRHKVFARDNYICQVCRAKNGQGKTIVLHPHHLKSFTHYPKLRFNINNGQTVCVKCHHQIHYKTLYDEKSKNYFNAKGTQALVS